MKTYVVAGMHGDEPFTLKIASALRQLANPDLALTIGNPEAFVVGKRYIETDLNRSFSCHENSLESRLATSILQEIHNTKPDYIIDVHTSITDIGVVGIVAGLSADIDLIAGALNVDAVVVMPKSITKHSLIGHYPQNALSLEIGRTVQSPELSRELAERISSLTATVNPNSKPIKMYEVFDTIPKNYANLHLIKNLDYEPHLKGYPFLAGPETYDEIGGFLARLIS